MDEITVNDFDDFEYQDINGVDVPTQESIFKQMEAYYNSKSKKVLEENEMLRAALKIEDEAMLAHHNNSVDEHTLLRDKVGKLTVVLTKHHTERINLVKGHLITYDSDLINETNSVLLDK